MYILRAHRLIPTILVMYLCVCINPCCVCNICSLQLFVGRRGFRLGVLRLQQPSLLLLKEAPVGPWLPLPLQLLRLHSPFSPVPPPPLGPATLPRLSSDSSLQQTAPQVPLIGTATSESLQCLVLTVQGRNGGTLKER